MTELACGYKIKSNDDGTESRTVQVAYSIVANAAVPYHAKEYYYEVELLEDPSGTRYVSIFLAIDQILWFRRACLPKSFEVYLLTSNCAIEPLPLDLVVCLITSTTCYQVGPSFAEASHSKVGDIMRTMDIAIRTLTTVKR
jgi:hypothetical protein